VCGSAAVDRATDGDTQRSAVIEHTPLSGLNVGLAVDGDHPLEDTRIACTATCSSWAKRLPQPLSLPLREQVRTGV